MKFESFLSERTRKRIADSLAGGSHALIVESPLNGQHQQMNAFVEYLNKITPGVSTTITPEKNSIGIEAIKKIRLQFSLKNPTSKKRLVLINYAEKMTHEAQNALLKILEEPPEGTIFVINTASLSSLLPTVLSRGVSIVSEKPQRDVIKSYFLIQGHPEQKIEYALAISDGWPELAESILNDESTEFIEVLNFAKELLKYPLTKKLKEVDNLSKQKERIPLLLFALERLSHAANNAHIQSKERVNQKWLNIMQAVDRAQYLNKYNVNNRLILTELMISL